MIRILDAVTVGQIAAGEVVERPLSVVKELVENSIDAGATRVAVRIENGGLDLIEVADDGAGIPPEDLRLAVCRHATSKLAQATDLEAVSTLGFRGEGLASVAAVSQLEVISRLASSEVGARISAHAEEAGPVEAAAAPIGTIVRARDLFANVPVRREYLKSPGAESTRISTWLTQFALAYPGVGFTLHNDGKEVWNLPPSESFESRLSGVFGKSAASALIPLNGEAARTLPGSLRGYISAPGYDRPDRRMQLLFVNRRLVRNAQLAGAWTAGYATFTMTGRQPYGVLFLELPPDHVDPNVHPTKSEVRFRFAQQIFDVVRRTIASTLQMNASARFASSVTVSPMPGGVLSERFEVQELFQNGAAEEDSPQTLRVIGQIAQTYILATDGAAVVLIDQHAAHERVAYERIAAAAEDHAPTEPLLIPAIVDVAPSEDATLERTIGYLREGGLEIESFGERSYRIVATPAGYGARAFDFSGFLQDLAQTNGERDVRERVWASLACHSVARAGERLELGEMSALLERLQRCDNPMHCPHGRPTMVRLEENDLAKLFKRV